MPEDLQSGRAWARQWLFDTALPLWWECGADHLAGGWWDKLDQQGQPLPLPKRLRVQARQVFVFAEAGRLGWDGPWRDAVRHGIDYMLGTFRRDDGLFRASVTPDGTPLVDAPDLYDQAFVLFALASAYTALGKPEALRAEAHHLLLRLEALQGHPELGFEEADPRVLPLRSNPHMHLLEALLAWIEADERHDFERHARRIVTLACEKLIDSQTGAIGEYYDGDWSSHPVDRQVCEPGHQFEWSYLLHVAGPPLGIDCGLISRRLHAFGTRYGIRDDRTVFSVTADGTLLDGSARLWAQTERLRTMLVLAPALAPAERAAALTGAGDALRTLRRMLATPVPGLWFDRMDAAGTVMDEPAPASSLYHIITGLVPLLAFDEAALRRS